GKVRPLAVLPRLGLALDEQPVELLGGRGELVLPLVGPMVLVERDACQNERQPSRARAGDACPVPGTHLSLKCFEPERALRIDLRSSSRACLPTSAAISLTSLLIGPPFSRSSSSRVNERSHPTQRKGPVSASYSNCVPPQVEHCIETDLSKSVPAIALLPLLYVPPVSLCDSCSSSLR